MRRGLGLGLARIRRAPAGSGGGGGGVPAWVPAGATDAVDFDGNRAWISGVEYADIADQWGYGGSDNFGYVVFDSPFWNRVKNYNYCAVFTCTDNDTATPEDAAGIQTTDSGAGLTVKEYTDQGGSDPFPNGWYAFEPGVPSHTCVVVAPLSTGVQKIAFQPTVGSGVMAAVNGGPAAFSPTFSGPVPDDEWVWFGSPTKPANFLALYPNGKTIAQVSTLSGSVATDGVPDWVNDLAAPSGDLPELASWFAADAAPAYGWNWRLGLGVSATRAIWDQDADNWATWDQTNITSGVGVTTIGHGPVMTADVFAQFPDGLTGVVELIVANVSASAAQTDRVQFPDYNSEWVAEIGSTGGGGLSTAAATNSTDPTQSVDISALASLVVGRNRMAFTLTDSRIALSVNGATVVAADVIAPSETITNIAFALLGAGSTAIPRWIGYQPQPEADLPTLSAL